MTLQILISTSSQCGSSTGARARRASGRRSIIPRAFRASTIRKVVGWFSQQLGVFRKTTRWPRQVFQRTVLQIRKFANFANLCVQGFNHSLSTSSCPLCSVKLHTKAHSNKGKYRDAEPHAHTRLQNSRIRKFANNALIPEFDPMFLAQMSTGLPSIVAPTPMLAPSRGRRFLPAAHHRIVHPNASPLKGASLSACGAPQFLNSAPPPKHRGNHTHFIFLCLGLRPAVGVEARVTERAAARAESSAGNTWE